MRTLIAVLLLTAAAYAQSDCPATRPVDDFIAEIHKQQSKMKNRNTNPLPDIGCIFNWCRQAKDKGDEKGTPPRAPQPSSNAPAATADKDSSSSKNAAVISTDPCDIATEQALEAAHQTEVGDFNFDQRNYRGALSRYQDAADKKPNDLAIEVRLGRSYERLKDLPNALAHYQKATTLQGPDKWQKEATSALNRLNK